ncbi:MAG: sulfite exporter TauE/SafE family protein [Candidatus Omnitrophota bacterium]|nr:MAG: sulfite exporter TauE/SafE family protein [Candidatus Omnitrophota bacterium]
MLDEILIQLEKVFTTSPALGLGVSFLAGLLVSFSPCIYPLIPITLGVVGAASASSRLRVRFASLTFVLGICVSYTILGVVASMMGLFLGDFFINPVAQLVLAFLFIFLGLSYLEVLKFHFSFSSPDYSIKREELSIFLVGMVSAFAMLPCNFPVLGAILSLISLKKNVFYGAVALFLFSLGYCALLLVFGMSTTLIRKIPKQGRWMIVIKRALGLILIVIGVYFGLKFFAFIR